MKIKTAFKIPLFIALAYFTWGIFSTGLLGVEYESDPEMRDSFWKDRKTVEVGGKSSKIPVQLPGVSDAWASSTQNEIVFPKPFNGDTVLAIYVLDSHESIPPKLGIFAGGKLAGEINIRPGSGKGSWYKYDQFSYSTKLAIPASLLGEAEEIKIKSLSGSWVAIDRIKFTVPVPAWELGLAALGWIYFMWSVFKTLRRGAVNAASTTRETVSLASIYMAFALSGFSALVYQVSWQRMLGLFSGSDSVSSAIIVGSFLLGLGLGNFSAAKFADSLSNKAAFLLFALCETLIAGFGFASKYVFYDFLFEKLVTFSDSYLFIFVAVFALLLTPTFMMGLSLPLLSKAVTRDIALAPSRIGWLYGANTFGAGVGAFAAGFYLVGTFGYEITIWTAGFVNLTAGTAVVALYLLKLLPRDTIKSRKTPVEAAISKTPTIVWDWLFLFFLSGFIAISLEVVWLRMLGAMFHSSAYSFSLILGIFLVGDAFGIIAGSYIAERLKNPKYIFIEIQGAIALYAATSLLCAFYLYSYQPSFLFLNTNTHISMNLVNLGVIFLLTLVVVFPPAALMGFSFPIVQSAVQNDSSLIGNRVGLLQLANIIGNASGSIITGMAVFWMWGSPAAIKIICIIAFALMAALLYQSNFNADRFPIKRRSVLMMAAVALAAIIFPGLNDFWSVIHSNKTKNCFVGADHTGVSAMCRDGSHGTHTLYTGGKSQGYLPFSSRHVFYSVMGPLIHPKPEKILVIGLGTGAQAYTLGSNPDTKRIDVVEIVNPVYSVLRESVSAGVAHGVGFLFSDPRYNFTSGDGRRALFTRNDKFDIIQTDAIVPTEANSGMLFSKEYFTQIRASLAEDGLALQWLPTRRSADTFLSVFPNAVQIGFLMIGSKNPINLDIAKLKKEIAEGQARRYLENGGVNINELLEMVNAAPVILYGENNRHQIPSVNTDLFPKDEFHLNTPYRG